MKKKRRKRHRQRTTYRVRPEYFVADFGHKQQTRVKAVDGRDVTRPDLELVFGDDGGRVGIVVMTTDLEQIDLRQDLPQHDIVELEARGRSRRNLVSQKNGDPNFGASGGVSRVDGVWIPAGEGGIVD